MYGGHAAVLKTQEALLEVERLKELFLLSREQAVAADKRRQDTREALAALRKLQRGGEAPHGPQAGVLAPQRKVWVAPMALPQGPSTVYTKCTLGAAVERLEAERQRLDGVVHDLQQQQKRLLASLAERGGVPDDLVGAGVLGALVNLR